MNQIQQMYKGKLIDQLVSRIFFQQLVIPGPKFGRGASDLELSKRSQRYQRTISCMVVWLTVTVEESCCFVFNLCNMI